MSATRSFLVGAAALALAMVVLVGTALFAADRAATQLTASGGQGELNTAALPAAAAPYIPLVEANGSLCSAISPSLLMAQLDQESGFNAKAVSPTGAEGPAQFEPGTWPTWGSGSPFDPADAVAAQAKYDCALAAELQPLATSSGISDTDLMLAGYNAGPAAVIAAGGIPSNGQSPGYVSRIDALTAEFTTTIVLASAGSGITAAPSGLPTPAGGWSVAFADNFNVPFSQDPLWRTADGGPNNPWERESYASSQVTAGGGQLDLTATPTGGGYTSGRIDSNWSWTPGTGAMWDFEIVAKFPTAAGRFNAFWTSSADNSWQDERDFLEAHDSFIDTDWIFNTATKAQSYFTQSYNFDPTQEHRYDYVVFPNQSWSFYIDGALQTWVGNNGVSPPEPFRPGAMMLILNYALAGGGPSGASTFAVNSVTAFEDATHDGGDRAIAPGTTIGATSQTSNGGDAFGTRLIQAATAELGKPYQWGGAGPGTFDCSGLLLVAANKASDGRLKLPHSSEIQATLGQAVDAGVGSKVLADGLLEPGDVIAFALSGGGDYDHIGIYVGAGKMIAAPHTGGVVSLTDLTTSYWTSVPWIARRYG